MTTTRKQVNFQLASNTPAGNDDLIVTSGYPTSNVIGLAIGN
jgi:hypothetical protein